MTITITTQEEREGRGEERRGEERKGEGWTYDNAVKVQIFCSLRIISTVIFELGSCVDKIHHCWSELYGKIQSLQH